MLRQINVGAEKTPTKLLTWSKKTLSTVGMATVNAMFKVRTAVFPIVNVRNKVRNLMQRKWFRHIGIELHGIRHVNTPAEKTN